jgi:hypothetical protein
VKNNAIWRPSRIEMIPEVNTPVRSQTSVGSEPVDLPDWPIMARIFLFAQGRLRTLQDRLRLAAVQVHPLDPTVYRCLGRQPLYPLARSLDLSQGAHGPPIKRNVPATTDDTSQKNYFMQPCQYLSEWKETY